MSSARAMTRLDLVPGAPAPARQGHDRAGRRHAGCRRAPRNRRARLPAGRAARRANRPRRGSPARGASPPGQDREPAIHNRAARTLLRAGRGGAGLATGAATREGAATGRGAAGTGSARPRPSRRGGWARRAGPDRRPARAAWPRRARPRGCGRPRGRRHRRRRAWPPAPGRRCRSRRPGRRAGPRRGAPRRAGAHQPLRQGADAHEAEAGLVGVAVAAVAVPVGQAADGIGLVGALLLRRHEAAGAREADDRHRREAEAGQRREAGEHAAEDAADHVEQPVAGHAAEAGGQGPAGGGRQGARHRAGGAEADDPEGDARPAAGQVALAHQPHAPQGRRQDEGQRAEPEQLHGEVRDHRPHLPEDVVGRVLGGMVEARVVQPTMWPAPPSWRRRP